MLSERIVARNFKGIREVELDIRNIDCAVVVGHNGAGKSSLIVDARLWAVFGESFELRDLDKHVRNGTDGAEVIYEWEASGKHYRVTRKRSVKTAKGSTLLKFEEKEDGGDWENRSGESVGETQARILKAFPIDMATLCNSSIIGQGEVEAFCKAGATDRAKILSKILNQERYKDLEKMARKEGSNKRTEMGLIEERIKEDVAEAEKAVEAERLLQEAEEAVKDHDAQIREREKLLSENEKKLARVEQVTKDYGEWKEESAKISEEVESLNSEMISDRLRIERYQKILENKDTVKAKTGEETVLKKKEAELRLSLNTVQGSIRTIKDGLLPQPQREALTKEEADCQAVIADKSRIERVIKEGEGLEEQLKSLKERKAERDGLIEEQRKVSIALKDSEHEVDTLREKIDRMREQMRMLDGIQCHPEEDPKYVNESCGFLTNAVKAKKKIGSVGKDYNEAVKQHCGFRESLDRISKQLETHETDDEMVEDVQGRCNDVNNAKADLVRIDSAVSRIKDLNAQIEKDDRALAELTAKEIKADKIQMEIKSCESELSELSKFTKLLPELEKAESELPLMEDRDRKNVKRREELSARESEIDKKVNEAEGLLPKRRQLEIEIDSAREGIAESRKRGIELNQSIGRYEIVIRRGKELVEKGKELGKKVHQLKEDAVDWDILVEGFKQLPFLVYEKAVPDIEDVANEILQGISPFGLRVIIETQKAAKTTKNVSDEIDLRFVDNDGEKVYAQLSGGESVRVALAIRLAIGELSAKRAGERIEELTIDEGWGPLDTEGIIAVKECMRRLRSRFKKMLVISHIDSVGNLFETQIVVDKKAKEQVKVIRVR